MTEPMQTLRDDIAFMRALAEEGRSTPMLGGAIIASAGGIFGLASVAHWALVAGILRASPWALPMVWMAAFAVFMAVLFAVQARMRGRPGSRSPVNRAIAAGWSGVGFAIFAIALALGVAAWRLGDGAVMGLFPSVILALYGAAWFLAGKMTGRGWMVGTALGAFVFSVAIAFLIGRAELFLAYAAALFLLAGLPGVILVRQEPSDLV
jgi:hypothetical protein